MLEGISYPVLWLVFAVVLAGIEAATMGIVTIWFAIGALVALVAALIGFSFQVQVIVFVITSGVLLYFTRPIIKNYLKIKTHKTNADRIVGEKAIVTEKIDSVIGKGQVKVLGQVWSARSVDRLDIDLDEIVEVQEIAGVRLIVKKLEK